MKCSICGKELNAPHGIELAEGVFVCGTANCAEFAVRVVQAARAVVAAVEEDDALQSDAEDVAKIWDAIEKLREALAR